jgi:5,6-dimethylbenzimidazole synthase
MVESLVVPAGAFSEPERTAVYRAIGARRDVRHGFVDRPLPDELLKRLLSAAHSAPSVGFMQPSRFIVIRSLATRKAVHDIFQQANAQAAASYAGERGEQYAALNWRVFLKPRKTFASCATRRMNAVTG